MNGNFYFSCFVFPAGFSLFVSIIHCINFHWNQGQSEFTCHIQVYINSVHSDSRNCLTLRINNLVTLIILQATLGSGVSQWSLGPSGRGTLSFFFLSLCPLCLEETDTW